MTNKKLTVTPAIARIDKARKLTKQQRMQQRQLQVWQRKAGGRQR